MSQFLIVYLGGDQPKSPEEGQKAFAEFQQWVSALGDAFIAMKPIKDTHTLNPDGSITESGNIGMSGYNIIEADSMEQALEMARTSPFLDTNGTLEVSELIDMSI